MPRLKNRTIGMCAVPPKRILCPQKTRAREREVTSGGNLVAPVRREAVYDEDLPRRKLLQAPPDVELLVFLKDDYSEIGFSYS